MSCIEDMTPAELKRFNAGRGFFSVGQRNYGTLKRYGDTGYKVTFLYDYVEPGARTSRAFTPKCGADNDAKLENNLSRAKSRVFELACCNPWELFVTLTINQTKLNRYDLPTFRHDLSAFLYNWRARKGDNIRYLLIPERHKDGAWHMHGFIMGLPVERLHRFELSEKLPVKIINRIQQGKAVYTWQAYADKFGFADIERIENLEASAKYITKYVTKDVLRSVTDLGAHVYYASKGLQGVETIRKGDMFKFPDNPTYKGDFCAVQWYKDKDEALECFP